jgi:hypothetical protein
MIHPNSPSDPEFVVPGEDLSTLCFAIEVQLDLMFMGNSIGKSRVPLTHSAMGHPRYRAMASDPTPGRAGAIPVGIAQLTMPDRSTRYIVEEAVMKEGHDYSTQLWWLTGRDHQLETQILHRTYDPIAKTYADSVVYDSNDPPSSISSPEDLKTRWGNLARCMEALHSAYTRSYDQEVAWYPHLAYPFVLEALGDAPAGFGRPNF